MIKETTSKFIDRGLFQALTDESHLYDLGVVDVYQEVDRSLFIGTAKVIEWEDLKWARTDRAAKDKPAADKSKD
jgi:hypothetical protein